LDACGGEAVARAYSREVDGPTALTAEVVLPALRGRFGREYHYAAVVPTTQRMLPAEAGHGAVALAEHQTEGRGRLGRTWLDEPGAGLTFSVVLTPPPPVARWPELTLLAAHAVADELGDGAAIKHPNDVLVDGRKVAGILAEAGSRVVLGVGINVGSAPWPGAGYVERDRLQLLTGVLARLELAYEDWAASR
jgi:BirA family transcriptional regulator, biotin operon repressor / biotin---[acetyl-CoA-carboxylase] ligase